ncbi:MAG: glycosyltransferase family A protein [archaeon]|nr:glycosyltransferase family A protein [archaeon]
MQPRVLVGCPIFDGKEYCFKEFLAGLASLTYGNFDVCLVDNSKSTGFFKRLKQAASEWNETRLQHFSVERMPFDTPSALERIVRARNVLAKKVLDEGYGYFFSLEADVVPPADAIERLMARKKDIVSGVYFNLVPVANSLVALVYKKIGVDEKGNEKTQSLTLEELLPSRLIENTRFTGVGCMLISRKVLEHVSFRFEPGARAFDDWWFCTDANAKGFSVNADSSMFCMHYYRPWVTERSWGNK